MRGIACLLGAVVVLLSAGVAGPAQRPTSRRRGATPSADLPVTPLLRTRTTFSRHTPKDEVVLSAIRARVGGRNRFDASCREPNSYH
jgi:hypothetical protein